MGRRAIFTEDDLRRWARIARAEGVAIRGTRDTEGNVTVIVETRTDDTIRDDNSFDRLIGGAT